MVNGKVRSPQLRTVKKFKLILSDVYFSKHLLLSIPFCKYINAIIFTLFVDTKIQQFRNEEVK